jgi:hypothetical protein
VFTVTWSDITIAGAFIVGVVVGGLGVIRITGYVLSYLEQRDRER